MLASLRVKPGLANPQRLITTTVRDFMAAVCGEEAVTGVCEHSVAQQLSTSK